MKKLHVCLCVWVPLVSMASIGCVSAQAPGTQSPGGQPPGVPSSRAPSSAPRMTSASTLSLEQKVASVLPTKDEDRWLQIPWRANIMEARAEAERAGKPMFLWIMDGNPLACG